MRAFVAYAHRCSDEKGDAQVFCDRLFRAFGHAGYKEAGAVLEDRVRTEDGRIKFADLVWKPRLLLEMKKRGENLARHYTQALHYWMRLTPNRPRYVILSNFEDFWIYDFNTQMDEPMDRLTLGDFVDRYTALNFLFPEKHEPLFRNNRAAVTDMAATKIGGLFRTLVARGEPRERAQRFTLQCVVAMFSEDTGLLPRGFFTELVDECLRGGSSYDLIGSLFRQMDCEERARGGRFKKVRYFNGGIFQTVDPIELKGSEIESLHNACQEQWSRINPAIFGTLFQASMESGERHRKGAHYTPETAIMRVVLPTIVQPWQTKIRKAQSVKELLNIRSELTRFRVLDPACGSGNFLYVAYRELKRLELSVIERVHEEYKEGSRLKIGAATTIQTKQFFGIDSDPFAVELAKVTLVLAKKLAFDEAQHALSDARLGLDFDAPLPLENLDDNITCNDALFCIWPAADAIIGNPPYQSKNKAQAELSPAYMQRVRARYPEVPGRADYCVYWFRRAHDELKPGSGAGLVGTKTIKQNYSREGGLDYIVRENGTIVDAVGLMKWPGSAVLSVAIANWVKGPSSGKHRLTWQTTDSLDAPWKEAHLDTISSSLSPNTDTTEAKPLAANRESERCTQGQTHGHEGFLLDRRTMSTAVRQRRANREVLCPYLIGDEIVAGIKDDDWRFVIDFADCDQLTARARYPELFTRVEMMVLPDREAAAKEEDERNAEVKAEKPRAHVNKHHHNFLRKWWQLSYARRDLIATIAQLPRYIACSRVTKQPIFVFVSSKIHPSDVVTVFTLSDDYSFGILQSRPHWLWFKERGSGNNARPRYTSTTVFDTFPWPQTPSRRDVAAVAKAAVNLRAARAEAQVQHGISLRSLYATLEKPGDHALRTAQDSLDLAVRRAYGMETHDNALAFLLDLNTKCAARELDGERIVGPGLPITVQPGEFVTEDCLQPPSIPLA
ncbi:MAG TPA: DNA methyltransferase [Polyangiaceae bacterium]|nr:DNA methyltransferase [Polyangiaceae bacterium]